MVDDPYDWVERSLSATTVQPVPREVKHASWELEKAQLVAYLLTKVKSEDWHAVQDAASDIREIEAKLQVLRD